MVRVFFGNDTRANLSPDMYFNNTYDDRWFDDPVVKQIVLDIDRTKVISSQCIQSPVLGQIAPERISGGAKTLILLLKDETFYTDLVVCGENCQDWLARIFSSDRNIRVAMSGFDIAFSDKEYKFKGYCENDGTYFEAKDWLDKALKYVRTSER